MVTRLCSAWVIDMWQEHNLPNFYSSMTLLFSGLLSFLISLSERNSGGKFRFHWLGLAVLFTFAAIDEMIMIHELLIEPLHRMLGTSGIFFFAWVIPYGIAVVVLGILYLRFFFNLAPPTRTLMAVAGAVYLAGALGLEMLGGIAYEQVQARTLFMDMENLLEETMEMIGVLIFIRALTGELARRRLQIQFSSSPLAVDQVSGAFETHEPQTGFAKGAV